jgi:hypothetical protein
MFKIKFKKDQILSKLNNNKILHVHELEDMNEKNTKWASVLKTKGIIYG